MSKYCLECGCELRYRCIPLFNDINLGVAEEWYECSHCKEKYSVGRVRRNCLFENRSAYQLLTEDLREED